MHAAQSVAEAPRIPPGDRAEIGSTSYLIATLLGLATGTSRPNLFTTLARHRRLFRPWLRFAGALMPRGVLPRTDGELVILRVAFNCGCDYEWLHHERIAQREGLSGADVARVREGSAAEGWSPRQALLLRAVDELHERRCLGEATWGQLSVDLGEKELIELCMLVGHYEMLAMTLNSLRVQPDRFRSGGPSTLGRALARLGA
jgi:alkylhydroperoxidase family enzyme